MSIQCKNCSHVEGKFEIKLIKTSKLKLINLHCAMLAIASQGKSDVCHQNEQYA